MDLERCSSLSRDRGETCSKWTQVQNQCSYAVPVTWLVQPTAFQPCYLGTLLPNLGNKKWQPVQNCGHSQNSHCVFLQPAISAATGFLPAPATGRKPWSRRLRKTVLALMFWTENVPHTAFGRGRGSPELRFPGPPGSRCGKADLREEAWTHPAFSQYRLDNKLWGNRDSAAGQTLALYQYKQKKLIDPVVTFMWNTPSS